LQRRRFCFSRRHFYCRDNVSVSRIGISVSSRNVSVSRCNAAFQNANLLVFERIVAV
jgi:hypothetical protein